MDGIGERISLIIEKRNLKKVQFANAINVDQSYVSQLAAGKRNPSDRTIADICREFGVSELWLRTGEGEMFIDLGEEEELLQAMEEIHLSDDVLIKEIILTYWRMPDDEKAALRKMVETLLKMHKEKAGQ